MTPTDLNFLRKFVQDRSGIVLGDDKLYLFESRLGPVCQRQGLNDLGQLVQRLREKPNSPLHAEVVESMTTNETFWFRDGAPFDALKEKVLPFLAGANQSTRKLAIWCAASSTGQEPYTIAMIIRDHFPQLAGWQLQFLATDLSPRVIAKARAGRYTQAEVDRGLAPDLLKRHFSQVAPGEWQVNENLRKMWEFRELNLLESWFNLGTFDIVFIRNVLIYFNTEVKSQLLMRVGKVLAPHGFLYLGGAESPLNLDSQWVRVPFDRAGLYRKLRSDEAPPKDPKSGRLPAVTV